MQLVERLASFGVKMEGKIARAELSNKLEGLIVVISGTFEHHSRDEYKDIIERNGGKNVGSVSGATSFILMGENMGPSKLEKAQSLGVAIVSEDEFLAMLG